MADVDDKDDVVENHDPHFEPIVNLPQVDIKTLEEDEEELIKIRARLYRFDRSVEPPEWKERGTGDVKILSHRKSKACRILMRREKTLKICANHHVLPNTELKKHCQSEKAFVWSTPADFADEKAKEELLAIRFGNVDNAQKFKKAFDIAKEGLKAAEGNQNVSKGNGDGKVVNSDEIAEKLDELSVKDELVTHTTDKNNSSLNATNKDKDKDKPDR